MTVQDINQLSIWAQTHAKWIGGHTADSIISIETQSFHNS